MAYYDNLEEQNQQQAGQSGVIAGSGGAASQGPATTGTGFTNLQKYLSANQGSGGGIADNIVSQGQNAVTEARTAADTLATGWADAGVKNAQDAASTAASTYDTAANTLRGDPNADITGVRGTIYGGPKAAQDYKTQTGLGVNDLDTAYQNVKNTATSFAGDYDTQKAGLQKQYGYGSGFGALDTFLGRQDGRDKIQGWANNVNPGSAQSQVDRVNSAIGAGKQSVSDAQAGYERANREAKIARSIKNNPQTNGVSTQGRGIADMTPVDEPTSTNNIDTYKQTGGTRGRNMQR